MTDSAGPPEAAPLQFDKADYVAPAAMTCGICHSPIGTSYYDVNGHPVCEPCLQQIRARPGGDWTKALALGLGAAAAGSVAWFAVEQALNLNLALIAIGIGWLVGKGVRKGAGTDQSLGFPVAAVVLTYLSIAGAYFLDILKAAGTTNISAAALGHAAVFAVQMPFRTGHNGSPDPIGLFIVGIGLYEAWRFARRPGLRISGPFPVSRGAGG